MSGLDPILAVRYRALALDALRSAASPFRDFPARLLVVDVARQRLGLLDEGRLVFDCVVSTAAAGVGSKDGSFRTPPGWHRIQARIGEGAEPGTVFRSRIATGEVWKGEVCSEDLILTRILTMEGLEDGVNRGPGRDSLERFIYLHGTNQEHLLGQPVSHGCIRVGNAEVAQLFDLVQEGELLLVAESQSAIEDPKGLGRIHFVGVAGSGMSALAQYLVMSGGRASGSDRAFDRGQRSEARSLLESLGVRIHPQDGSAVSGDCCAVVFSTAIEETVSDFAEARRLGVPVLHRSELLAHFVTGKRTIAVTGTSGKSTVVAMIFEILRGAGMDPSVITGGELLMLQETGLWGNARAGTSDLLVVEADESDGSLVRYHPALGVILNLQKDHKEMDVVAEMFRRFAGQVREKLVLGEGSNLSELSNNATRFGFGEGADLKAEKVVLGRESSSFLVDGTRFEIPVPGLHNVENALAAISACKVLGLNPAELAGPLSRFKGVARRFQVLGSSQGVEVVDDFGHNPAKVAASLRTARLRARRVLAVFQPHGYAPTRFLRRDFVESFASELRAQDRLWWLEVYYAGGTATKDFSSADIVSEIAAKGALAEFAPSREWLVERIAAEAKEGDLVLVMGARDPSLRELAQSILVRLTSPE